MTLKIGRIDIGKDETTWEESPGSVTISGYLMGATLADTLYLREELVGQVGPRRSRRPVAIVSTLDPTRSGFFFLDDVSVEAAHKEASYTGDGRLPFTVTATRIGSEASAEFQSMLTTALLTNNHGLIESEVTFWHCVPPLANNYTVTPPSEPIANTRDSEEGTMQLFFDISTDDDPRWSITPDDYYSGAARITVDGRLRAGTDVAHNPDTWTIENGIIRVSTSGAPNNGQLLISRWNGASYEAAVPFELVRGANVIPNWNYMAIYRNDPEVCVIHLERDADEATPTAFRHTLELLIRRGAPWVRGYYSYTGPTLGYTLRRTVSDAAVTVTPSGAASPAGVMDSAGTYRWITLTALTHTDVTAGQSGLTWPATRNFDFMLGFTDESDANSAGISLGSQYHGWSDEQTRLIAR